MKKVIGETKLKILEKLEQHGGEFKTPRGGLWTFCTSFKVANAYMPYLYRHMRSLISMGYIKHENNIIKITDKGRELIKAPRRACGIKNAVIVYL